MKKILFLLMMVFLSKSSYAFENENESYLKHNYPIVYGQNILKYQEILKNINIKDNEDIINYLNNNIYIYQIIYQTKLEKNEVSFIKKKYFTNNYCLGVVSLNKNIVDNSNNLNNYIIDALSKEKSNNKDVFNYNYKKIFNEDYNQKVKKFTMEKLNNIDKIKSFCKI